MIPQSKRAYRLGAVAKVAYGLHRGGLTRRTVRLGCKKLLTIERYKLLMRVSKLCVSAVRFMGYSMLNQRNACDRARKLQEPEPIQCARVSHSVFRTLIVSRSLFSTLYFYYFFLFNSRCLHYSSASWPSPRDVFSGSRFFLVRVNVYYYFLFSFILLLQRAAGLARCVISSRASLFIGNHVSTSCVYERVIARLFRLQDRDLRRFCGSGRFGTRRKLNSSTN